jgi:hypothetical protein
MTALHDAWRRLRITKAAVDSGQAADFKVADGVLAAIFPRIAAEPSVTSTAAGQAALLTAVIAANKCFERVRVSCDPSTPLIRPLLIGSTLGEAVVALGGQFESADDGGVTHDVLIGSSAATSRLAFRCWWDGWKCGLLPAHDTRPLGGSWNPLAGVFAGALAVRAVFAAALGAKRAGRRVSILSLWEPWVDPLNASPGPSEFAFPSALWIIGLGHLGQGVSWNLAFLPFSGRPLAVLQDDQTVAVENEAPACSYSPT